MGERFVVVFCCFFRQLCGGILLCNCKNLALRQRLEHWLMEVSWEGKGVCVGGGGGERNREVVTLADVITVK